MIDIKIIRITDNSKLFSIIHRLYHLKNHNLLLQRVARSKMGPKIYVNNTVLLPGDTNSKYTKDTNSKFIL